MGMFSFLCRGCGHPMLSRSACDAEINAWMSDCIALDARDPQAPIFGTFDGYGRLDGAFCDEGELAFGDVAWWHRACWEVAGKPPFDQSSANAPDQGWFFDDGAHDMLDPREQHAEGELARRQAARDARRAEQARREAVRAAFERWIDGIGACECCGEDDAACFKRECAIAARLAEWKERKRALGCDVAYEQLGSLSEAERGRLDALVWSTMEALVAEKGLVAS